MRLFDKVIIFLSVITVIITVAILTEGLILGTVDFVTAFKFILMDFLLMLIVYIVFLMKKENKRSN